MKFINTRQLAIMLACFSLSAAGAHLKLVSDPYAKVIWDRVTQHKANLHTHTVASGGKLFLRQAYEAYAKNGYTILAVTDHDLITAWGKSDIDPLKEYGILQIKGEEYSDGQHVNGLFVGNVTRTKNINTVLQNVGHEGGVAVINHPGRYWNPDEQGRVPPEMLTKYGRLFEDNQCLLGVEVINESNFSAHDISLWDALLGVFMPTRPVWGFANDDMHKTKQIAQGWDVFLLNELNEEEVRRSMTTGSYYFSTRAHESDRDVEHEPPVITSITHDPEACTLTLVAAADGSVLDAGHYRWVAEGRTLCEGRVFDYGRSEAGLCYVRAEVRSQGGTTYTNPFGFLQTVN